MSPSLNSAARERWLARLRRYRQSSGLTIAEFCRTEGVSYPSFYQWKKKLSAALDETTDHAGHNPRERDRSGTLFEFARVADLRLAAAAAMASFRFR